MQKQKHWREVEAVPTNSHKKEKTKDTQICSKVKPKRVKEQINGEKEEMKDGHLNGGAAEKERRRQMIVGEE